MFSSDFSEIWPRIGQHLKVSPLWSGEKKKYWSENFSSEWQIVKERRRQKSSDASRIISFLKQPRGLAGLRHIGKSS